MDARKLEDVLKRIARIRPPNSDALEVSQAAVKPLAELLAAPNAAAGWGDTGKIALNRALAHLRGQVADATTQATREFYENVLSAVARLKD